MVTSSPPSLYVNSYQVKLAQLVSCGPALFFPPPHIFASHSLFLTCLPAQPPDPIWTAHPTSPPAFPGFAECSRPGLSLRELCSFYATLFPTLHRVTVKKKMHVGLNMSVTKLCNPLLTRGALILWTLKSIKTPCTEAAQCGTMMLLKKLPHFPHFSHCPEEAW